MSGERAGRPVSETIESGFSAKRRPEGKTFKELHQQLAGIAVKYPGKVVLHEVFRRSTREKQLELDSITMRQTRVQAEHIGRLRRVAVYQTIRKEVPSFGRNIPVKAKGTRPDIGDGVTSSNHVVAVRFGEESRAFLHDETEAMWSAAAGLVGLSFDDLGFHLPHHNDLVVAEVLKEAPDAYEISAEMRQAIDGLGEFSFWLKPGKLLPTIDERSARPS